jgi:uncharacterized protein YebE (UPF0316 family)
MSLALLSLLFVLGVVDDVLVSFYTLSCSRGRAWAAGGISLVLALANVWGLFVVIDNRSIVSGVVYALGCAAGTILGVRVGSKR